jgi:hypothetical protein
MEEARARRGGEGMGGGYEHMVKKFSSGHVGRVCVTGIVKYIV